jgi:hypothetical protein
LVGTGDWDEEWELLASVPNGAEAGLGTSNMTEYRFDIDGVNKEYRFFRFEVLELCGVEDDRHVFQLAEFRVRGHAYKALPGDVNGDGKVNVTDVTTLVNMILGVIPKDQEHADLTGDGKINVSDVTALINNILGI